MTQFIYKLSAAPTPGTLKTLDAAFNGHRRLIVDVARMQKGFIGQAFFWLLTRPYTRKIESITDYSVTYKLWLI